MPRIDINTAHLGIGRFDKKANTPIEVCAHEPETETVYHIWISKENATILVDELSALLKRKKVDDDTHWIS